MSDDSALWKLIERARQDGSVTFESNDIERDRQKLYRMFRSEKRTGLPLFPPKQLEIKAKDDKITLVVKADRVPLVVSIEQPKPLVKPIKKKKEPKWIERWREAITKAEELPDFARPKYQDAWEYYDSIKFALDLWEDGDDLLQDAIQGDSKLFPKRLAEYFGYKGEEGPLTITDRINKLVYEMGQLDPKDPEYDELRVKKDRLVELRDKEKWRPGADLLG